MAEIYRGAGGCHERQKNRKLHSGNRNFDHFVGIDIVGRGYSYKNGDLWFTEQMANKLGRFDPASQNFKEYPLTSGNSGPHGLVSDNEGNIWFTANFGDI
jgi:hypothetical protein